LGGSDGAVSAIFATLRVVSEALQIHLRIFSNFSEKQRDTGLPILNGFWRLPLV
jgi:hypothetical protein